MASRLLEILNGCKNRGTTGIVPPTVKVAVHDGKFHLDELVALTLVSIMAESLGLTLTITRTRDPKILELQDIVLDVGCQNNGKYFDHHQQNFDLKHRIHVYEYTYATSGIVWDDLGIDILNVMYNWNGDSITQLSTFEQIRKKLILPVDAIDNGEWKYKINGPMPMMLPDIINNFNEMDPQLQEEGFRRALSIVELIFRRRISLFCRSAAAIAKIGEDMARQAEDPHQHIFVMNEPGPWLAALQCNWETCIQFALCIYPTNLKKDTWNIQTFPMDRDVRQSQRCPAPEEWRGWSKLYQNTGKFSPEISSMMLQYGVVFVHVKGFLASVKGTLNTAKEFAKLWLINSNKKERNNEVIRSVA